MKKQMLMTACALMLIASPLAAQTGSGAGSGRGSGSSSGSGASSSSSQTATTTTKDGKTSTTTTTVKTDDVQRVQFVRTLTNVQIELTLTDQIGTQAAEKKTVSMIASSGNWGKIRSAANVMSPGEPPYTVELNVDARPFVSIDGLIQLELTLVYAPVKSGDSKQTITESIRQRPSGINQSQTVILQSGKALVVSQAADPVSDRKVVIEVKATVLK